jgi:hypothetical protein
VDPSLVVVPEKTHDEMLTDALSLWIRASSAMLPMKMECVMEDVGSTPRNLIAVFPELPVTCK